jgi:hypothetical protein
MAKQNPFAFIKTFRSLSFHRVAHIVQGEPAKPLMVPHHPTFCQFNSVKNPRFHARQEQLLSTS